MKILCYFIGHDWNYLCVKYKGINYSRNGEQYGKVCKRCNKEIGVKV